MLHWYEAKTINERPLMVAVRLHEVSVSRGSTVLASWAAKHVHVESNNKSPAQQCSYLLTVQPRNKITWTRNKIVREYTLVFSTKYMYLSTIYDHWIFLLGLQVLTIHHPMKFFGVFSWQVRQHHKIKRFLRATVTSK